MPSTSQGSMTLRGWLWHVTTWFIISAIVALLLISVVVPRLAGATPYTILTGSMAPEMPPGSLVLVKPVDPASLTTGTVITYQIESGEPTVVTHRIVSQGVQSDGTPIFLTKGDANESADKTWVRPVQIKGERWISIPHVGRVTNVLSHDVRQVAVNIAICALLGYAAFMFGTAAVSSRRRGRSNGQVSARHIAEREGRAHVHS